MKDEGWHIELLKVVGKIRLRESLDAVVVGLHSSHHALQPPVLPDAFRNLGAWPIVAVERERYVPIKLRPIRHKLSSQVVEDRDRQANRILVRLHHERRHRADEHGHGHAFCTMPPDVASDFSATGGMAHMDYILEIEFFS